MDHENPYRGTFLNIRYAILVCLLLVLATLAVYWQVRHHTFVNYDDNEYVTDNPYVRAGLTLEGIIWSFTKGTQVSNYWHPLTWLSHMLDCQLYGMDSGWHHLTNVLFHIANTLLLFLVLFRMTGHLWRSSLVAGLFALHPLHVESVAWVAERKDVLSTFFWLLAMWAYVRYTERAVLNRYLLALLFFAMGLMSKPMLVTFPFALFLIDYWPLSRLQLGQSSKERNLATQELSVSYLIWEKLPFLALAATFSVAAFLTQQRGGALPSLGLFPLKARVANALVSYAGYIGKMIWPCHLAVFYPHPQTLPSTQPLLMWQAVGAGLLLICLSVIVAKIGRQFPYLIVGWLWYLGTLVPVIGIVQIGAFAMADRYTYVSLIGLFLMIAWGVPDLVARWRCRRTVLAVSTGMIVLGCMICTWLQVRHWRNSITLFGHALKVTDNNYLAHYNLGIALMQQGMLEKAISHYFEAVRISPNYVDAHNNLGVALASQGRFEEAGVHFQEALRLDPSSPESHNNLGVVLMQQGKLTEAINQYSEALRINPSYVDAHNNLGFVLVSQGRLEEASIHFREALRIDPSSADAHNNLGFVLASQGSLEEAITHFREALRIKPDYANARSNLEKALVTQENID